MKELFIDLETYSPVPLAKTGVYPYAENPEFEILLFGVSVDGGPVTVYDLAQGDKIPEDILRAVAGNDVIKWAYNAGFERVCLSWWIVRHRPDLYEEYGMPWDSTAPYLNPSSWRCSMVLAVYNGLPRSLAAVGAELHLPEQKLTAGKDLIRYFCQPCKPTKSNGFRTRNFYHHAIDKWELFKSYNKRDVEVELAIHRRLKDFPVPESVWDEYHIDQQINDRGIGLDLDLVKQSIRMDAAARERLLAQLSDLTRLPNPNSVPQLKGWLADNGCPMETLGKKAVAATLAEAQERVATVLRLRQQVSKSSVKKYDAMLTTVCADGRARGMFAFYGAGRSGRWAGRHIQLQNLPQNHIDDLEGARNLVKTGDLKALQAEYPDVSDTLSQLIRTAFVPKPGCKFIVADFSAIEARVLSFLAGESWRLKVFETGGDIYCASASQMFHVPVEKHGVNGELRQKGKIAELALGYGGGVGALKAMGALEMGVPEDELQPLVDAWRAANPRIVDFWWAVDAAAKEAVVYRRDTEVNGIRFMCNGARLSIALPSGRQLNYLTPLIEPNEFGGESITYMGIGRAKKWERIESYGPKLVENITQAVARDILAFAMKTLRNEFITAHVHDELIIECPMDATVEDICARMGQTPLWIKGLYLRADGYETMFYKKD